MGQNPGPPQLRPNQLHCGVWSIRNRLQDVGRDEKPFLDTDRH